MNLKLKICHLRWQIHSTTRKAEERSQKATQNKYILTPLINTVPYFERERDKPLVFPLFFGTYWVLATMPILMQSRIL